MTNNSKSMPIYKMAALAMTALAAISLFLPWLAVSATILGSTISKNANAFSAGGSDSFGSVLMIVAACVSVLAALLAAFGILKDRKRLVMPLAIMSVVMFIAAIILTSNAKSFATEQAGILSGVMKISIGIGAWLFLVCGIGAYIAVQAGGKAAAVPAGQGSEPINNEQE